MRHELMEKRCAALGCGKRTELIRVKTFCPGLLIGIWLCREHEQENTRALHERFREEFGVDFVDPARQ